MNKNRSGNNKVNVSFVIIQTKMGGAERLVYNLIRSMERETFFPSLIYFNKGSELEEFERLNIPIYHIPKSRRLDLLTMKKISRIVEQNEVHVINAHHFMPMLYSFYACKITNRVKLIYTAHSEWEVKKIPWYWKIFGHILLAHSDKAVGVTGNVSNEIRRAFRLNQEKTLTILNGVAISDGDASNGNQNLKKALKIGSGSKVIGVVANFRKVKNHIFLLKAFRETLKEYKNVKLLLIGQGFDTDPMNSEPEIRRFINENDLIRSVLILGYRPDVAELLSIMDIFCLTSLKEGLPISLIEAMGSGLPVVGTDVEGIKDVILHNKNGFLVRPWDIDSMKRSLLILLENEALAKEFGRMSRNLATERYSLARCISQYQQLFFSLAKECEA